MPAVMISVIKKAYHTPSASKNLLSTNASGRMTTIYRAKEMLMDGNPLPSPSNAPEHVTDTQEAKKPKLIICSALTPICIVSVFVVNNPIKADGNIQDNKVPTSMTAAVNSNAV